MDLPEVRRIHHLLLEETRLADACAAGEVVTRVRLHQSRSPRTRGSLFCHRLPNGARLSCGALKKDSFPNLRAPSASSAG